jgi:hypothetical protein
MLAGVMGPWFVLGALALGSTMHCVAGDGRRCGIVRTTAGKNQRILWR